MAVGEHKALTRRMWEGVWNDRRVALIDEAFAPEIAVYVQGGVMRGRDGLHAIARAWFASFPDLRVAVEEQVAEGDRVCDRLTFSGTHTGAAFLDIEAANRPFRFTQTTVARIAGGSIAELWEDVDFYSFVQQLGMTLHRPAPVEPAA